MASTKKTTDDALTETERKLNSQRCRVCGKFHPFILVCPFVRSTRVEILRDAKNPSLRGRITTTEYYPRSQLMTDGSVVSSLTEAEDILKGD